MDAAFPLMSLFRLITATLVSSPPIFGSIGTRKSARNPLALLVVPVSCTLGGIDGGFVHWDKLSNLLKR